MQTVLAIWLTTAATTYLPHTLEETQVKKPATHEVVELVEQSKMDDFLPREKKIHEKIRARL
jgi:hypothetical protein